MLPQNDLLKKALIVIVGIFAVIIVSKLIIGLIKYALIIAVIGAGWWFIKGRRRRF